VEEGSGVGGEGGFFFIAVAPGGCCGGRGVLALEERGGVSSSEGLYLGFFVLCCGCVLLLVGVLARIVVWVVGVGAVAGREVDGVGAGRKVGEQVCWSWLMRRKR
jgi:hypothetical protein